MKSDSSRLLDAPFAGPQAVRAPGAVLILCHIGVHSIRSFGVVRPYADRFASAFCGEIHIKSTKSDRRFKSFDTVYMTTTTSTHHKLSHSRNTDEQFQALDRALARRYVFRLLHEQRLRRIQDQPQGDVIFRPRVEICDDPSSSRITATLELPGLKADDVRVTLERDNLLAISGERTPKAPSDRSASVTFPVREIKYGKFLRTLDVPSGTMMSTISAAMSDGMLLVSWPRFPPGATARSPQ